MPNYDYVCEKCGHEFEVFQSMKDDKLKACPREECVGSVRRLLGTGAGIIFKGGGFYQTDYRSDSYMSGAKKETDTAKPAETAKADSGGNPAKTGDSGGNPAKKTGDSGGKSENTK